MAKEIPRWKNGSDAKGSGGGTYNSWSSPLEMTSSLSSSSMTSCPPSDEKVRTASVYVVMAILVVLSVIGTAGNALVMYVFSQKKDKLVSTLFILVLAFVDFVTCLVVIPYTIYIEYVDFAMSLDVFCKLYQFLITSNIPFSAFIMVAIAVDRYFCICHPFLQAMTVVRAKLTVGVLGLMSAAIGVCVSLMYGVSHGSSTACKTSVTSSFESLYSNSTQMESASLTGVYTTETPRDEMVSSIGVCQETELIVGKFFREVFQKFYTALYLLCLVVVIALYVLIYRSVLARRARRQSEKSKSLSLVVASAAVCRNQLLATDQEVTLFTTDTERNGFQSKAGGGRRRGDSGGGTATTTAGRKSVSLATKWDLNRMANLKTAAMLFVVTVVFVVTFLPAFLMALGLVPYNIIVFYMYFANNVANPVIYSFMNKNFRDNTKKLLFR